ncbi:hypothetical protein [Acidipropionibacterium virtanenii]|uniref:Uncharacterized protein n=1 Tax=Acidipropionibacterium virtanenii TaxID=2057246 RepID=A0A344URG8_9ACTN|nr:hypothetical protein [Acidipropionibacterium virtanenii]AXE37866.1 hypothetical protein JS278_00675 [Acidipropionibacterium virtanenii]
MRVMPFRALQDDTLEEQVPRMWLRGKSFEAGEDISGWDYLTEMKVEGRLAYDPEELIVQSGLVGSELRRMTAVIRADCPATGERFSGLSRMDLARHDVSLALEIPAGTVAEELEVQYEIVLNGPDSEATSNRAAHLKGSRLYAGGRPYRFRLEGDGSLFPVEAVSFRGGEFPARSAWLIKFQGEDLIAPFMGSVRLFVNRDHPVSKQLIDTGTGPAKSVLMRDVLLQMLVTVASRQNDDEVLDDFPQGSTGAVLDELCANYLDEPLQMAVNDIRETPYRVFSQLQESTSFLEGAEKR